MIKKILFCIFAAMILVSTSCNKPSDQPIDDPDIDDEKEINYRIEITNTTPFIYIGDEIELNAKVYPETENQEVTWRFQNASPYAIHEIASLEGNVIKGLNYGSIYVYATSTSIQGLEAAYKLEVKHILLEEEGSKAYNISGFYGVDASNSYSVHYMIKNTKSFVEVTKSEDTEFANATKYYGSGEYFEDLDKTIASIWPERNVWDVDIEGLEADTSYIYRINNGDDTYSDVYHFKTAGGDKTTFLYITDTHYASFTDGTINSAAVEEEAVKSALKYNPNIDFILSGGDLIDTGANEVIWNKFFSYAKYSLTNLPYIGVMGNHELYVSSTSQRDGSHFGVYWNGPNNGSSSAPNSTCYFIHNDTLFILVDNGKGVGDLTQLAWMADVLENTTYKHSIITFHTPVYGGQWTDDRYLTVFDKYGVDLVLTGHTHSEAYYPVYYNSNTVEAENIGTTYLTGAYSGIKSSPTPEDAINRAKNYIVEVSNEGIHVQTIIANGTLKTAWDIKFKNTSEREEATNDELFDSIKESFDEETLTMNFTWSSKFYRNVKKITVYEEDLLNIKNYEVCPTPAYTQTSLKGFIKGRSYTIHVLVEFADGKKRSKDINLDLSPKDFNISIDDNELYSDCAKLDFVYVGDDLKYYVTKYVIVVNDKEITLDASKYMNKENSYYLEELDANTEYTVTFKVIDFEGKTYFTRSTTFKTPE